MLPQKQAKDVRERWFDVSESVRCGLIRPRSTWLYDQLSTGYYGPTCLGSESRCLLVMRVFWPRRLEFC